jgi:hypothetical protein
MSFRKYMSEVRTSGAPLGYFARALDTHSLPEPQSWDDLQNHLLGRKADAGVIVSARVYWREYQASGESLADAEPYVSGQGTLAARPD